MSYLDLKNYRTCFWRTITWSGLEMEAPEDLRLVRNGLREMAVCELKARGPRKDAVFSLLDAMRLFREKSPEEVREFAFKIGMPGQRGAGHQQSVKVPWREIGNDQTRGRSNDTSTSLTDATSEVLSPSTGAYNYWVIIV